LEFGHIFYGITAAFTLTLAVLTLQRLLSGWWRQYYLLAFLLVLLLVIAVPAISSFVDYGDWTSTAAQKMYWTLSLTYQVATFFFVLQLIYRVGKDLPTQASLVRGLTIGALLIAGLSVLVHSDRKLNAFMTLVSRDLTFLMALLNLILWKFLLQIRKRSPLLLAVSAGLGIQCAGDAIGHSIRLLSRQFASPATVHEIGNMVMSMAGVVTIAVWYKAFSRAKYGAGETPAGRRGERVPGATDPSL
jgi:hypothetical protein